MNAIYQLFNINQIPDLPDQSLQVGNKLWHPTELSDLYLQLRQKKIKLLNSFTFGFPFIDQHRKFPLMKAAVEKIRGAFSDWDQFDQPLIDKIKNEWKKLLRLSELLEGFRQAEDQQALFRLMTDQPVESRQELACHIELLKLQQKPQLPFPVASIFKKQRDFRETLNEAKTWTRSNNMSLCSSNRNAVYRIGEYEAALAYFKTNKFQDHAASDAALWEKLIWDISVVLGFEDLFVPTELMALEGKKGCIQSAIYGNDLFSRLEYASTIKRKEVIKATLATLFFGMFDAHGCNIFLDSKGKFQFFDNAFSFPHSNHFVDRGDTMDCPYRSGLFELDATYERLSAEELMFMRNEIDSYPKKGEVLSRYLQRKDVQETIAQLPPHWVRVEEIMEALNSRVENMRKAVHSEKVSTLSELVAETICSYKFTFLLKMCLEREYEPFEYSTFADLQKSCLVGNSNIDVWMQELAGKGFDLELLFTYSQDPFISFEEAVQKASRYAQQVRNSIIDDEALKQNHHKAGKLLQRFLNDTPLDLKDQHRGFCYTVVVEQNLDFLRQFNVPFYLTSSLKNARSLLKNIGLPYLITAINTDYYLIYQNGTKIGVKLVDLKVEKLWAHFPGTRLPRVSLFRFAEADLGFLKF